MRELILALVLASSCATSEPRPSGIYFVMVDRFENGDRSNDGDANPEDPQAFHGGDLQGVINRLDWIQSLGFDTVWLSPIFKMRVEKWHGYGAFHGYWTWDLSKIEPRFGDESTLSRLREALAKRGMKLLLDLVLNHVGPDAPLQQEHPDWFHNRGGITDWNDPRQLVLNDVHGLPDLATEKPEVFAYLSESAKKWHADGFRLDAVKHLPLDFWSKFNAGKGESLGELLDGNPDTIANTWKDGGFTSMFDFPLGFAIADVFCRGAPPSKLAATLTNDRRYPDPLALVTLVDNHDLPRLMSVCGNDVEKVKNALTFLIAMRGTPSIIWGTEVGLDGDKEPDNRKSMRFDEKNELRAHVTKQMRQRAASAPLREGGIAVVALGPTHLELIRMTKEGDAITVRIQNGSVTTGPANKVFPEVYEQWRSGARKKAIRFEGAGFVVGSGPELGDWNKDKAVPLPATIELPLNGVFEFKRLTPTREWAPGENNVLHVEADAELIKL